MQEGERQIGRQCRMGRQSGRKVEATVLPLFSLVGESGHSVLNRRPKSRENDEKAIKTAKS